MTFLLQLKLVYTGLVIYFAFGKSQCYTVTLGSSIANIRSLSTKPDGLLHVVLFNAIIILCMQKFFEHCSQRPKTSVPITSNMMPRDCKIVNIDVSKKKCSIRQWNLRVFITNFSRRQRSTKTYWENDDLK